MRNALAGSFDVIVEPDFPVSASDSIRQLDNLIRPCELVIHVVGSESGSVANADDVDSFKQDEPFARFLWSKPELLKRLGDLHALTYPQWEVWLAVNQRIPVLVFEATVAADDVDQSQYLEQLNFAGCWVGKLKSGTPSAAQIVNDVHQHFNTHTQSTRQNAAITATQSATQRFLAATNVELINNHPIPRSETQSVLQLLNDSRNQGVLIVAEAGAGKSCILAQVCGALSVDMNVLAFKLDSLPECSSATKLGSEIGLPTDPITSMLESAAGQKTVIVIDQLDAVSTVSARKTSTWDAFDEICRMASLHESLKVVVACRSFDLEQDHRLRRLDSKESGFAKVSVSKLSEAELRTSLDQAGLTDFKPDAAQSNILQLPLHLTLFLQGDPTRPFSRVGELYDRYWDRKLYAVREKHGDSGDWLDVVQTLCNWMSEHQSLTCPKDSVDDWHDTAMAMVSVHVIVPDGGSLRFFHESFFDYSFARCFCKTGETLFAFLTKGSDDQQLFRRSQVRQILGYRREHRLSEYLVDLETMLSSEEIRFHIRRMVAAGLRQITNPKREELEILLKYLFDHELSGSVSGALRSNAGWFDLLVSNGIVKKWMNSSDERLVNLAVWILSESDLHKSHSERVAELLEPYFGKSEAWNNYFRSIFSWGIAHKSQRMWELFLRFFQAGGLDRNDANLGRGVWGRLHEAEKEAPKRVIDLAKIWLERTFRTYDDGTSWSIFDRCDSNKSDEGSRAIAESAKAEPAYFLEQVLPEVVAIIRATTVNHADTVVNRAWPYLSSLKHVFDVNDAILLEIWRAFRELAKSQPQKLRDWIATFRNEPHETFGYLIMEAYSANPAVFADECAQYMLDHHPRFYIGYGSWSGEGHGESAVSRRTIEAISPWCSQSIIDKLEDAIVNQCDEYERSNPKRRGFAEYLLLQSIAENRRSNRVTVRISELSCNFPKIPTAIPEDDFSSMAKFVGSPIPVDRLPLMTDDQWISATLKYDGSTDRFEGGPVELSRALCDLVMDNPGRFAALAIKMPDTVEEAYFSAILDGLTGGFTNRNEKEKSENDRKLAAIPTSRFSTVIHRLHSLPDRPCGRAIVRCIQKLADRELPDDLLEIVSWYAMNDPDPNTEIWQQTVNGTQYYGGDAYTFGINTVRGHAAEAIGSLLYEHKDRWEKLEPSIRVLVDDSSIAVRICSINALLPLLNYARDDAVAMFVHCCQEHEEIWASPPFGRFLHYAILTHYHRMEELLNKALNSKLDAAVSNVATQVVLADLGGINVGSTAEAIRTGNDVMREAACGVYATNIGNNKVGDKAADFIRAFFNDPSDEVRKEIGKAFWRTDGDRLFQLEPILIEFIGSAAFHENAEHFLHSLDDSRAELPHIICLAAERLMETLGAAGSDSSHSNGLSTRTIGTLVVRQYSQTTDMALKQECLNLIDQMERLGFYGIGDELRKIDR